MTGASPLHTSIAMKPNCTKMNWPESNKCTYTTLVTYPKIHSMTEPGDSKNIHHANEPPRASIQLFKLKQTRKLE